MFQLFVGWFGLSTIWLGEEDEARGAFLCDEDGLAVFAEQDEVCFPVSWLLAALDESWALFDRYTVFDMLNGASALVSAIAALRFSARQKEPPGIVLGASDLGVDEAVDGFVADGGGGFLLTHPSRDLLGGVSACEVGEDAFTQGVVTLEARAAPAPGAGLLLGIDGSVT